MPRTMLLRLVVAMLALALSACTVTVPPPATPPEAPPVTEETQPETTPPEEIQPKEIQPEEAGPELTPQPLEPSQIIQGEGKATPVTPGPGQPDLTQLPQVAQAKADLAQRLDIPEEAIQVVLVEEVIWPDGSLGCPQPGIEYPQVPQDGLRIVLEVEGERYEYRSGGVRPPFLCQQ